ncbi:hypothetical protein SAMN05421869_13767, partial [Nonomuraea jiangxiensis]
MWVLGVRVAERLLWRAAFSLPGSLESALSVWRSLRYLAPQSIPSCGRPSRC